MVMTAIENMGGRVKDVKKNKGGASTKEEFIQKKEVKKKVA